MDSKPYPLLQGGGFLTGCAWLRDSLKQRVALTHPNLRIQTMKTKAEWGAVYMAADLAGVRLEVSAE
jgi:hypothetical protein